jgi:plasmid stabilization system protein ParE
MAKQIILTDIAKHNLEHVIGYLTENWGISVCEKFLHRFEQVCEIISDNPAIYPFAYKKEKIRKCVLTHQNMIYYREYANNIEIITIFDTRQDPAKLVQMIGNI